MPSSTLQPARSEARAPRLTRAEVATTAGVWASYALLAPVNWLLAVHAMGAGAVRAAPLLQIAAAETVCWTGLTLLTLGLARRIEARPALVVALTAPLAIAVGLGLGQMRITLLALERPGRSAGGAGLVFAVVNAVMLYAAVLAVALARAYSQRYRSKRERETQLEALLARAQLDALRRQLDPHFLFNTLNLIASLAERDPAAVPRVIARLSDLLRASLEGADRLETPLREELALLEPYLEIMRMRYQGRLDVAVHADAPALDVLVPSLVLQPLVENAIKHGAERVRGVARVQIDARVEARAGDAALVLRVRDNGPGVVRRAAHPPSADGRLPGAGVGLRNTVARLEQLYGPAARFALRPGPDGGTVAEVRVPLRAAAVLHTHGVLAAGGSGVD